MNPWLMAVAHRSQSLRLAALVLAVGIPWVSAPAPVSAHAAAVFPVPGARAAGPARYDRVLVERFGPASARTVLVLVPGGTTGAGAFAFVAPTLAGRVHGLQVWAVERREQAFEDISVIERGDPDQALAYYLQGQPVDGRTFRPPAASEVGFMAHWGLRLLLGDLHRVLHKARAHGRRVMLGGVGLGAAVAEAYAAWDFAGRAGHRDLTGLVVIDGGMLSGVTQPTLAQTKAKLHEFQLRPRLDPLDQGTPWVHGAASAIAGLYAQQQPQNRSPLDDVALLPAWLKPPFASTNETFLGYASARLYPPHEAAAAHFGHPAASGSPRGWVDGDVTPIARLARWLTQTPINTINWYAPRRLALDVQATDPLTPTPITHLLHLRPQHLRAIQLPLYAFQTSSFPHVLDAARRFARRSHSGPATLVADPTMIHSDPLTALPARNTFLRTVTPFLTRHAHQASPTGGVEFPSHP
jgi:hypothetical protein